MKKEQEEYNYLTVYSESGEVEGVDTVYVKMEITTGSSSYPDLIEFCIKDDNNKHIITFSVTGTTAHYIQNYLKTYLEVINH